jgi:hypothetical protein
MGRPLPAGECCGPLYRTGGVLLSLAPGYFTSWNMARNSLILLGIENGPISGALGLLDGLYVPLERG